MGALAIRHLRASLEVVLEKSNGVDRYEIQPDRVVFYLWPQAGGVNFDFTFSASMAMSAKSSPSVLYDYYNPEALVETSPFAWAVRKP